MNADHSIAAGDLRGAVGVLIEEGRFLVIRRSQLVRAPGLICFPGGSIEPGEAADEAVRRECHEEIGLQVQVETHLWSSVTPWGFHLEWFQVSRHVHQQPVPNPQEVAEILWLSPEQLAGRGDLLGGMTAFLAAWQAGRFST